jgi:cbb3-type cytochrome oxidase maturation protein
MDGLLANMARKLGDDGELTVSASECLASSQVAIEVTNLPMDILYLLIPLSVVLALFIVAGLWWAVNAGQFDELEKKGKQFLDLD